VSHLQRSVGSKNVDCDLLLEHGVYMYYRRLSGVAFTAVFSIGFSFASFAQELPFEPLTREQALNKLGSELRTNAPDIVRMLPELTTYEARQIKPGTYAHLNGRSSAQFVARQLETLQTDFALRKQKASAFQAGNTILFTSIGSLGGPGGAALGYEASEFINAFVDAGLDRTYRQIVVDSQAIVELSFNEASDERLNRARDLIERARQLEGAGDLQGAFRLRQEAVTESLQSGAFTQRLNSSETCKKIGKEACEDATRRTIETNSLRIDLNARQIQDLQGTVAKNFENISKLKDAFEKFAEDTNTRLNGLAEAQVAFSNELSIVSGNLSALGNRVGFQGQQIGFIQHTLWQKMSPPEKLAALQSGGFFADMEPTKRSELEASLKKQADAFSSVAVWGERVRFMNATSQLMSEISRIDSDIISEDLAIAVSKASFVADLAHQTQSLVANIDSLSSLTAWTSGISIAANALKLFGKPKTDPDQERFKAIMKALGILNEKIDKVLRLQRQTLLAIEEIDRKLVELDRSLNTRFDRIEEKIDYLTDLVSSSTVLPRSDACLRMIRQGTDQFNFDAATGFYALYSDREAHWKAGGRDMETCFDYISQVSTLYRAQGAVVDAVFLISERNNDRITATLKREHSFLTDRVRDIFRYGEQTPDCLRHAILVGARAPESFTATRPYFSYVENLSKLTCASLPAEIEPPTLLSAFEARNPAEARWSLMEQQIDQTLLLTFSDLALYSANMKRLLVRSKDGGGEVLLPASDLLDAEAVEGYSFTGVQDANDDLTKVTDLLDIAIAQESLKSGLLFLPFIEAALVENDFGHGDALPQNWHDFVEEVNRFDADERVVALRRTRDTLAEARSTLLPDAFRQESLNRRSLYLDHQIARLADLNARIEEVDKGLADLKKESGLLSAESKVLDALSCDVPGGLMTDLENELSELSEPVLAYCFDQLGTSHPSTWTALHRYLLATQMLERYPETEANFWMYLSVRNLTEGAYAERRECLVGSSNPVCSYQFDGPGGNRIGTSKVVINIARQSRTDSLLRKILPDMRFADVAIDPVLADETKADEEHQPAWAYTWIGSSGDTRLAQIPLTHEILGNSTGFLAQHAAPISHTPALQSLRLKRQQLERDLVLDEWVTTTLESENHAPSKMAEAVYTLNLLQK